MDIQQITIYAAGSITQGPVPYLVPPALVHFSREETTKEALTKFAELQVLTGNARTFTPMSDTSIMIDNVPHYTSFNDAMGPFLDEIRHAHRTGRVIFSGASAWSNSITSVNSMTIDCTVK